MIKKMVQHTHKEFLNALIIGDHKKCSILVQKYLKNNMSIYELYEDILKKSLYEIGELWEYNKISVASEHLASALVEAIINDLYFKILSIDKIGKTVIVSGVENELHQIGIRMIGDVFELNGWSVLFLGANTPTQELVNFAKKIKPDMIALSLTIYFHLPILEKMINTIRLNFPEMPILVGGQAFSNGGQEILLKYKNVFYKSDLDNTEQFIINIK